MTDRTQEQRTLRVGVMCNGRRFPRWQANVLRSLLDLPEAEVALLIVRSPGPRRRAADFIRDWRHLLWNLFNKGFVERRSVASHGVDLGDELSGVPEIECRPERIGRYGEGLSEDDLNVIRSADLDVILRFSFGILKGGILDSARFGVWSFHHGDEREYRGQPPGFWEMLDGRPTVGAILQRLTERLDAGTVLHRGVFRVRAHSYRRTRDELFLGSSDFVSVAMREIASGYRERAMASPSTTSAPVKRSPGNWTVVRFLFNQARAFFLSQWNGLTRASKWSIGVGDGSSDSLVSAGLPPLDWVPEQGAHRYLADPFPDPTGVTSTILVEDYDHVTHKGVISALDLEGDRTARMVLDAGVHASYPYLIEDDGVIYCVPETYEAEEIRLYRAVSWPDQWELTGILLQGVKALDPTVFEHEGRWWLFCTLAGPESNTKLYAYHSPSLTDEWTPHALNPIKTSVLSSRPAGTPFVVDGVLYRPAQDSSISYGGGITINRVDLLSPDRFLETEVTQLSPDPAGRYSEGIHTLAVRGERIVVDGRRDVFNLASAKRELLARVRRVTARSG